MKEYLIRSRSGMHLSLSRGERIRLVDVEGRQVLDFFAVNAGNDNEILSPGVTIDCNASLHVTKNDFLYSNLYAKMLQITEDTVGRHDLIHPCCRPEMYDFFYGNGKNHPNCLENINRMMEKLGLPAYTIIHPFNVFMNTRIKRNGKIEVLPPKSGPNDFIEMKALMDVNLFLAACSVSESSCNGGKCTPIKAIIVP
jgi:uncharacterized protein YcgI (DUF1989 family)